MARYSRWINGKRARLLLERGRAVVHKRYPFTIRLKDRLIHPTWLTFIMRLVF